LILSDEPFSRDERGPAPFIETIEHGANDQCSTPATEAFKRCLDAVWDDGLSSATLAKDLRGALTDLYSTVSAAYEAHLGGKRKAWDMVKFALERATPTVDGFDDPMGKLDVYDIPFPWHVAEWDGNAGVCVRAANGNSVFWAEDGHHAADIVARMNAVGDLAGPDGPTAPAVAAGQDIKSAPAGSVVAELECLEGALVTGLEVLRTVRSGKRDDGFDVTCLGREPHNEFEARRRIMNLAENARLQTSAALNAVRALAAWPRAGMGGTDA